MNELARSRVIAHVDLDAFYAAVETQRDPQLKGKPVAVVQYNPFGDLSTLRPDEPRLMPDSNGSIIAVSWDARKFGVKRNMMGQEGKKLCPELNIVQVPVAHGKADLTIYRDAGAAVVSILSRMSVCERASIDEVYLDVTEAATARLTAAQQQGVTTPPEPGSWDGVHVLGAREQQEDQLVDAGDEAAAEHAVSPAAASAAWWRRPAQEWQPHEHLLAAGATVVWELRQAVHEELGYTCSAGISHHKILAKLCSALHKPAQQTLVPASGVPGLLRDLPISKLRGLGGEFGQQVQQALQITTCGEVWSVPTSKLCALFGEKRGQWLSRLVWGVDMENDIKQRLLPNQISCGKTFRGHHALTDLTSVRYWLGQLGQEVEERCTADRAANKRMPTSLSVAMTAQQGIESPLVNLTRSCPLGHAPTAAAMADTATALIKKWAADKKHWRLTSLFLTTSQFVAAPTGASTITRFLTAGPGSKSPSGAASKPPHRQQALQQQQQQQDTQRRPGGADAQVEHVDLCGSHAEEQEEQGVSNHQWQETETETAPPASAGVGGSAAVQAHETEDLSLYEDLTEPDVECVPESPLTDAAPVADGPCDSPSHSNRPPGEAVTAAEVLVAGAPGPGLGAVETGVQPGQPVSDSQTMASGASQSQGCLPASLSDWLTHSQQQGAPAHSQHVPEHQDPHNQPHNRAQQHGLQHGRRHPPSHSTAHQSDARGPAGPAPAPVPHRPTGAASPRSSSQAAPGHYHQLSAQDVDPAVLAELPVHIQQELRADLGLAVRGGGATPSAGKTGGGHKRKGAAQHDSKPTKSIKAFFAPAKPS